MLGHWREVWVYLRVPAKSLGALATGLGALATCFESPKVTVEQSGRYNSSFGNAAGVPGNPSYYIFSKIFITHVFRLYLHLYINVAMYQYSYSLTHGISGLAVDRTCE
jgi:hypothetical protein